MPQNKPGNPAVYKPILGSPPEVEKATIPYAIYTPVRLWDGLIADPFGGSRSLRRDEYFWVVEEVSGIVLNDKVLFPLDNPSDDKVDEMIQLRGKPQVQQLLDLVKELERNQS